MAKKAKKINVDATLTKIGELVDGVERSTKKGLTTDQTAAVVDLRDRLSKLLGE